MTTAAALILTVQGGPPKVYVSEAYSRPSALGAAAGYAAIRRTLGTATSAPHAAGAASGFAVVRVELPEANSAPRAAGAASGTAVLPLELPAAYSRPSALGAASGIIRTAAGARADVFIELDLARGRRRERHAARLSAGAADAGRLVALNDSGVLDASLLGGAVVRTDNTGRIAPEVLPVGVGPDVAPIIAAESLSAGDFVNIFYEFGAAVRKASASAGREAHGFVRAACSAGDAALVYFEGPNTGLSGLTPGRVFLSTTPGRCSSTPPSAAAGALLQCLGVATSATVVNVEPERAVELVE